MSEMAAAGTDTVEMESRRAELEAVLRSPEFVRAPRLAHLLSYLCQKLWAGEANQIKEYSIALEVFNRGSSFDQDSDSIVRVEANRLRKRLNEYYAGDGASHQLQITIPVGQYVPRFEVRRTEPDPKEAVATDAGALQGDHVKRTGPGIMIAIGGGIAVLVIAAVWITYAIAKNRGESRTVEHPDGVRTQGEIPDGQFGPPGGEEIRILAGATRSLVDHAGKLWRADVGFTGGAAVKGAVLHVGRTLESAFYKTSRQGQFRYDIPLKKGIYEMRLHFAETVYGPDTTGGEGSRLMTVKANGQPLLTHFDVVGDAGASGLADVKVFAGLQPSADGLLHLEFDGEEGRPAMVSAIEILPGVKGHIRPVRVLARQSPYYSNDSHWWSPDNYFEGGQLATYSQEATGTDDPELYETERWGNFSYAIPVTPGKYSLVLHFAARRGKPGEPANESAEHVANTFNVFCNGRTLLGNFDLGAEAGKTDVVVKRFTGLEPNAQGKLLLGFVPVVGHAKLSGLEVLPEGKD